MVCSEISLAEVVWCHRVKLGGQDRHLGKGWSTEEEQFPHVRVLLHNSAGRCRSTEQVDQDDVFLGHLVLLEYLDGLAHLVTRAHNGVEQENLDKEEVRIHKASKLGEVNYCSHLPVCDIIRKFSEDHMSLMCVRV